MLVLVVAHLGVAALVPLLAPRLGRAAWAVAALPPLATLVWAFTRAGRVLDGEPQHESLAWVPALGLRLDVRLDPLSLLMVLIVSGIGALVLAYGAYYYRGRDAGREAGWLLAFAGVMLGLVIADHLLLLYTFWELTTVVSFLLIAGRRPDTERRRAAEQALLTTVLGGLTMLLGLIMLGRAGDSYRLSELIADPPRGGYVPVALVLILVGAFTKSAQMPFHSWLPVAMVAPTPVSAYLHAAAMVKAGVYLVARLAPGFADVAPWRLLVLTAGLTTMVLGAWRALREKDLKRLLAWGTISELGMLIALLGAGTRTAAVAGAVMLLAHALFKSSLFMVTGVIDHQAGTRDLRRLSRLGARLPATCAVAVLAAASMAGLPPLLGFIGEEARYDAFLHGGVAGVPWTPLALFAGSVLTVALSARYLWGAFAAKPGLPDTPARRPAAAFLAPAAVPAALGAALGLLPGVTDGLTGPYADAYQPPAGDKPYHLALWHGFTWVLGLSVLTLLLGLAMHLGRRGMAAFRSSLPRLPDAQGGYRASIRGLGAFAISFTRVTQVGSLPFYLTVVLATVVLLSFVTLLSGASPTGHVDLWRSWTELAPAAIVLGAALAATMIRHRLAAVLLTGAVGYGVACLFVARDALDLALTQFLVESLTLVVVVLVLRRLPPRFTPESPSARGRWVRAAVALATGTLVAVFALVATQARRDGSDAPDYARHLAETGSENAVNAIIVDFRALDTLGEISVLLVTAIGVVSLVRVWGGEDAEPGQTAPVTGPQEPPVYARDQPPERSPAARWDQPRQHWLPGVAERPGAERSVAMEVLTRVLFPSILVFSVFLLFFGHYGPGGGFAGGLVAGQAFVLRYLVGGRTDLGLVAPIDPGIVAGGGLVLAAGTGLVPLAFGGEPLSATTWLHVSTSLSFDIGVYVLVVGVILKLLSAAEGARA
ncbi:Na+/H+ antiporter subunit A [Streptomyces sp. MP131-18]|uniref:Na+/H+ antiporter subunit A n=1 Tax=Streptomyces sp. MP131-18 TaxID=1857892 RepID=UPI00097CBE12|nr:Na+/H+ antiporter subunit A [Streptomyces sp. MP131-18]ONK11858.1 Multiple resistance and pH homeostasis protein A [Streptomyces sp. MP131-18]